MNDVILTTEGVSKHFGRFVALKNITVAFQRNQLAAIIGPNGAGKSTYFNIISGTLAPSSGRLQYEGREISGQPQHQFARMGIAMSFQITNVFPQLTAFENVRVAVQARHARFEVWRPRSNFKEIGERAEALLETVGLVHCQGRPARELAHGEQRCLEVAMALACAPKLLLLDEPTAGMSPEETRAMMDLILCLAAERTVILVEHKMKLVMGLCQRIVVLHHGELLADGRPEDVRTNEEVKRVYLGQGGR